MSTSEPLNDDDAAVMLAQLAHTYPPLSRFRATLERLSAELHERAELATVKPGDDPTADAEREREEKAQARYDDEATFGRIVLRAIEAGDARVLWKHRVARPDDRIYAGRIRQRWADA